MGIIYLVHQHGLVKVLAGLLMVKAVKLRLVVWRSTRVNEQVRHLLEEKLQTDAEVEEEVVNSCSDGTCAFCKCPLWLRRTADERVVQLGVCGCMFHLDCLLEAATHAHGIGASPCSRFPRSLNEFDETFDQVFAMVARFIGLKSVTMESLGCPECHTANKVWRLADSPPIKVLRPEAIVATAGALETPAPPSVLAALRSGSVLCVKDLREALLAVDGNEEDDGLKEWQEAAASDSALRKQLQQVGKRASAVLMELLAPATIAVSGDVAESAAWAMRRRIQVARCSVSRGAEPVCEKAALPSNGGGDPGGCGSKLLQHATFLWG